MSALRSFHQTIVLVTLTVDLHTFVVKIRFSTSKLGKKVLKFVRFFSALMMPVLNYPLQLFKIVIYFVFAKSTQPTTVLKLVLTNAVSENLSQFFNMGAHKEHLFSGHLQPIFLNLSISCIQ